MSETSCVSFVHNSKNVDTGRERKMKRISACFFVLCLLLPVCSAHADRYILHSPGRGQLKSEEAVAIAKEYLLSLCPALQDSHLPDAKPFSKDYQFGPGWQWEVDTEDDVWVLLMPDAYAVVHGTTGEMLDWRFTYPPRKTGMCGMKT